jgi:hypothetical protein
MAPHAWQADEAWASQRQLYEEGESSEKYGFGFGFGDDMNGFGGPRDPTGGTDAEISYPFDSPLDKGVTLDRQVSGTRTYDLNSDGVAHFGQWPDWTEGVNQDAGGQVISDLRKGSEYYLRMWERAVGIRGPHKKRSRGLVRPAGAAGLKVGVRPKRLLRDAGQPARRTRGWRWEVRKTQAIVGAAFTGKRVGLVASSAPNYRAAGVVKGDRVSDLPKAAEPLGSGGLWVLDAGTNRRFVFKTAGGKVRAVGIGSDRATSSAKKALRGFRLAVGGT